MRRLLFAALTIACAAPLAASLPPGEVLPFIEDDYARALTEARARDVPIFVETWAPW